MIEAGFSSSFGIKCFISIEIGSFKLQTELFHLLESRLQMGLQVEGIIVIACYQAGGGKDESIFLQTGKSSGASRIQLSRR